MTSAGAGVEDGQPAPSRPELPGCKQGASKNASLVFGVITAVGAILGVIAVVLLALLERPYAASVLLGFGMVAMGVLRLAWPGRPWFSARNRWSDALVYALAGVAILYLAPWTALLSPV
ncbi:DUF3017 domain-containing protein [Actinomyces minihominis]|uniref:DUF3017 domain-containing protein n=1 Tax=Actinomyces minihominis TaxID=2002838 RepID=UPI0013EDE113|nr:DUF3017 domain-containing protein [Actinomyces minihominis]